MANELVTIDMATREALRLAHEKITFLGTINRSYDESFAKKGFKIGDSLRIRQPNQYVRTRGSRVMDVKDTKEEAVTLTVAIQDHVDMRFNSAELALGLDYMSEQHIEPAMAALIAGVEGDVMEGVTKKVYHTVGTAGTVVGASGDISALGLARAKLNQQLAPKDRNRSVQFDSVTMASIVNGTKTLFHDDSQIKEAFREGFIGRNAMADWYENEKTWSLSNGDDVAWAVDDVTALGAYNETTGLSTLNMDAMGTTATVGAVFTIDGLYDCHPETKLPYAHLKQFVITAVGTIATNQAEVTFSPAIKIGGARQNCYLASGVIADLEDNVVTLWGAASNSTPYRQNLMYHKDAFTFVTADLPIMGGADTCVRRVQDGISLRVWQDPDIRNDELLTRIDILYGYEAIRPQWAARLSN